MPRLFIPSPLIADKNLIIAEADKIHYLKDVLRLKVNQQISVVDDKGNVYQCAAEEVSLNKITFKVIAKKEPGLKDDFKLTIACALAKNAKFDLIVDKLTQIGVDRIIPMLTERVIVKLDLKKEKTRDARWKKIALSAVQQSQRISFPVVESIKTFEQVVASSGGFDLKLIPALIDQRETLRQTLEKKAVKNILALIGPEGDFTPEEVSLAKSHGFVPITLGETVLRVDTAAIAVASFIKLYELNH